MSETDDVFNQAPSFRVFSDIFEYLPEKDFVFIYNTGRILKVGADEVLIREGSTDNSTVYLIMEGEFKVVREIDGKQKTMAFLGPGNWVGEIAFSQKVPRTASVIATRTSRLLALTRGAFESLKDHTKSALMQKFYSLAEERNYVIGEKDRKAKDGEKDPFISSIESSLAQDGSIYSKSKLIQAIISNIPRLPIYAGDLIGRLNDAEISLSEVTDIIRQDPSLAAQILRYVNSPYYGFRQKITELKHAIVLLGLNQIYLLVIFNAIRTTMPKTAEFKKLQVHSVVMSYITAELAATIDPKLVGPAGTLGLLHDIGRSVIDLLKFSYPELSHVFENLDYATLGAMLLKQWNLPDEISEAIRCQDFFWLTPPNEIPAEYRSNVAMLAVAHLITDFLSGVDLPFQGSPFLKDYLKVLKLPELAVEDLALTRILPRMKLKMKDLPLWIRNFLLESPHYYADK